jgi:uncharacterized membrane protein YhaH (DUF805 family)
MKYINYAFANLFTFNKRASRKEYLFFLFPGTLIMWLIFFNSYFISYAFNFYYEYPTIIHYTQLLGAFMILTLFLGITIRRFIDTQIRLGVISYLVLFGIFVLFHLILPLALMVILWFIIAVTALILSPGEPNKYGKSSVIL